MVKKSSFLTIAYLSRRFKILLLLCLYATMVFAFEPLERRKTQFLSEPSYLVFPLIYSIPGIGSGIMWTGLAGNIGGNDIDIYGLYITGDAKGYMAGMQDVYLYPKTLIFEGQYMALNDVAVNNYEERGMDTEKDQYTLIELSKVEQTDAKITLTMFERRLEFFGHYFGQAIRVDKIWDAKGNLVADLEEPYEDEEITRSFGFQIDYTDDFQDPRKGGRLLSDLAFKSKDTEKDAEYFIVSYSASAFIPISTISTLAFNYYISDAIVTKQGETDEDKIREELGLRCFPGDEECEKTQQDLVDRFVAMRKYGTANTLGGDSRMRAYPDGRFQGAHVVYYSTELRWNLSEEFTPFDFGIWKDTSTGIQVAFFYETCSVADKKEDLGKQMRSSYGTGVRMVAASGFVYRGDYAMGKEGPNVTFMFGYPW